MYEQRTQNRCYPAATSWCQYLERYGWSILQAYWANVEFWSIWFCKKIRCIGRPKTGVMVFLWWSSPGQGLSVAWEGFCRPFRQGQVGHEVWVQVPFLSVDFTCSVCRVTGFLLPFGPVVCSGPLLWWPTAHVLVSRWALHAGLSEYKKKKKKKICKKILGFVASSCVCW